MAPLASLREAALVMRNRHVGSLAVVDPEEPVRRPLGILTDRDIVVAVIAVPGARPEGIRVCDLMQTRLAAVRESDGVLEAVDAMRAHGVRRLAVLAADGGLAGVVSADDVLRVLAAELGRLAGAFSRSAEREAVDRRPLDIV